MNFGDDYIQKIVEKKGFFFPLKKRLNLDIENKETDILTTDNCIQLLQYNFTLSELKKTAKHYKIKTTGNKKEITNRIYIFLHLSLYAIKIQKHFRGLLTRKFLSSFGPASKNPKLCTNETDFVTMEELKDLPYSQFFSFQDKDEFIYGFDICSLYNLLFTTKSGDRDGMPLNPYNRKKLPHEIIIKLKKIIRMSKIVKIPVSIEIDNSVDEVSNEKRVELRALTLFQTIDSLGNYSSPSWFLSLSRIQMMKFVRELSDIWNYRAQLSEEVKRNICPPLGDPFRNTNINAIIHSNDILLVKKGILEILENFVNSGVDQDSKTLGAYYVLGSLTLVNPVASLALPWLYQSFSYF